MTITLTDSGQRLYDAVGPLMLQDAENGNVGQILCAALATMLDDPAYVARDGINVDSSGKVLPGHAVLFDVDNVQGKWLPWLSQFVGDSSAVVTAPDDATRRSIIKHPTNFLRGRTSTIIARAQTTLTGAKTVIYNQNVGSDAWHVTISTYVSETPDPTATVNAIMSVWPAWLIPTINTITGGDYATLAASHSTYALMEAAHTHYSDIPTNPAA